MKTASAIALMFAMGVAAPISSLLFQEARFVASVWNFVGLGFRAGAIACWLVPARIGWSLLAVFLGVALGLFTYGLFEWFS